ncbi:MAG: hypothetical protein R3A47_05550 [Polyangiales bacterium]
MLPVAARAFSSPRSFTARHGRAFPLAVRFVQVLRCSAQLKDENIADFARFAGDAAHRYNGANGRGRIIDFVIQNEVNSNAWFDVGCGQGTPCNVNRWLDVYSNIFAQAYD